MSWKMLWAGLASCLLIGVRTDNAGAWWWGKPCPPEHTFQRAGDPQAISRFAKPSETPAYVGYYVGGGDPFKKGRCPTPVDGTWGYDYSGDCFRRNVFLRWWPKYYYQGGPGEYATDGPRIPKK
ncbi:MAG: hypothetical protein ACK4RK_05745 [Gemmataceae bacterium]